MTGKSESSTGSDIVGRSLASTTVWWAGLPTAAPEGDLWEVIEVPRYSGWQLGHHQTLRLATSVISTGVAQRRQGLPPRLYT